MSKKALHAHGCRRCRTRYVDACATRAEDDLCTTCRGGRGWALLIDNAAPHDCCRVNSRLATKDERVLYALAGRSNWHLCTTCKRTHPFRPTVKERS